MQEDNIAPIVGMLARATRSINKGDRFHFFINGVKHFGSVDKEDCNGEVYLRTVKDIMDDRGRMVPTTVWYIIHKKWLLDPSDLFGLIN